MSLLPEIERELLRAAHKPLSDEEALIHGDRQPGGGRWRLTVSALFTTLLVLAALAVAGSLVVLLGHGRSRPTAATTHHRSRLGPKNPGPIPRNVDDGTVSAAWNTAWRKDPACNSAPKPFVGPVMTYRTPSAAMLSTLPVLRRPATPADRLPDSRYFHNWLRIHPIDVYIRFVRRARVADGISFYLVPAARLGRPPLSPAAANHCYRLTVAALNAELPTVAPAKRAATRRYGDAEFAVGRYNLERSSTHEGVFLLTECTPGPGGTASCGEAEVGGQSPATIRHNGLLGGGRYGPPGSPTLVDGIVPSGVASVTLHFPARHRRSRRLPAFNATGSVLNDVFVIPVPTLFQFGWPTSATWYSASGKAIHTAHYRACWVTNPC